MATVALLVVWTVFELVAGSALWAVFVGALLVLCIREFFMIYDPANYEDNDG